MSKGIKLKEGLEREWVENFFTVFIVKVASPYYKNFYRFSKNHFFFFI